MRESVKGALSVIAILLLVLFWVATAVLTGVIMERSTERLHTAQARTDRELWSMQPNPRVICGQFDTLIQGETPAKGAVVVVVTGGHASWEMECWPEVASVAAASGKEGD